MKWIRRLEKHFGCRQTNKEEEKYRLEHKKKQTG